MIKVFRGHKSYFEISYDTESDFGARSPDHACAHVFTFSLDVLETFEHLRQQERAATG